jgi:small subunit ribosomal protein S17
MGCKILFRVLNLKILNLKILEKIMSSERNLRKTRIGVVSSSAREKTITVKVERKIMHPMYGKFMKKTSKFHAHDDVNSAGTGDTVLIMETRPLSKLKRWRLVEVIEKAK